MQERLMPHFAERKMPVEMVVLHCSAFPLEKCLEISEKAVPLHPS